MSYKITNKLILILVLISLNVLFVSAVSHDYYFVKEWGGEGSGAGKFKSPKGIVIDDENDFVYVADCSNYRIQKFYTNGTFIKTWKNTGNGKRQFRCVLDVDVDENGYVYALIKYPPKIMKFDGDGTFLNEWDNIGGQYDIAGLDIDSNGNMYVTHSYKNNVSKYDSNSNLLIRWGDLGSGPGQLDYVCGIAVDDENNFVYVTDSKNHRIQKFDSNAAYISEWGSYGNGPGEINRSYGIAVSSDGEYVYVTDYYNHRIQKFDSDGNVITIWGSYGNGLGEINRSYGIAVSSDGEYVYVTDIANHKVLKYKKVVNSMWYDCDYSVETCSYCDLPIGDTPPGNFSSCDGAQCFIFSGERNIISNPSFERDLDEIPDEWEKYGSEDFVYYIDVGIDVGINAPHGSKIITTVAADSSFSHVRDIPVETNTDYTLSFHVMGNCPDIRVRYENQNDITKEMISGAGVDNLEVDYELITQVYNTGSNDVLKNFRIVCANAATLYIDAIQIEKGNENTSFSLMPGEYSYGIKECCGDDFDEYYKDGVCCDNPDDCVDSAGTCVSDGSYSTANGEYCNNNVWQPCPDVDDCWVSAGVCISNGNYDSNKGYCYESVWQDCDDPTSECGDVCEGGAVTAGASGVGDYTDLTTSGCCGDDDDEYYNDSLDIGACCNSSSHCVDENGICRDVDNCALCGNGICGRNENNEEEDEYNCPADCLEEIFGWDINDIKNIEILRNNNLNSLKMKGPVAVSQRIENLEKGDYIILAYAKRDYHPSYHSETKLTVSGDIEGGSKDTGFVDPYPNWKRLELECEIISNDGTLTLTIEMDSTPGSILLDNVSVIKKTNNVNDEIPYFDSTYRYGCCRANECWNGSGCVELSDIHKGFSEQPMPVCVETDNGAEWKLPYEKENWNMDADYLVEDIDKYCPSEDQCWFSGKGAKGRGDVTYNKGEDICLNKGESIHNLFCDPWTTRSAVLAANLLKLAESYDGDKTDKDDFTLVCDNSECFSYFSSEAENEEITQEEIKNKCSRYALTCVYKSKDTIIAGALLENSVPDPPYETRHQFDCKIEIGGSSPPEWETEHPDTNPKCFLQEILEVKKGFGNNSELTAEFSYQPYFTTAILRTHEYGENTHKIQSAGWNNLTKILIISNKDLEYEELGKGTDTDILWEKFERLKQFKDGNVEWPDNINYLSSLIQNTEDFNNIILHKKGDISFEAINEKRFDNSLIEYSALLYGNKINPNICSDLSEVYADEYGGSMVNFDCSENPDGYTDAFAKCGEEGIAYCNEYELYGLYPEAFPDDPKFKRKIWHDLTFRFRNFSYCVKDKNYEISPVPDYYADMINKEEDFVSYENRQSEGCCLTRECWNGFECVSNNELFTETEEPNFICVEGGWEEAPVKYDWDMAEQGYCAYDHSCYVSQTSFEREFPDEKFEDFNASYLDIRYCTEKENFYYEDRYCLDGTWTTRTGLLASAFLIFTDTENIDDFTLFCDNYTNTLNVIDFTWPGGGTNPLTYMITNNPTNEFCVLKYMDRDAQQYKVAFGTSLNNDDDDVSGFLYNVLNLNGNECDDKGTDNFEDCYEEKVWWDNNTKIVVYNKDGMQFMPGGFLEQLWNFLLDPIRSVVNWVLNILEIEEEVIPEDFDRYYAFETPDKNVRGVVVKKTPAGYVLVTYDGFTTNIKGSMERRDSRIEVNESEPAYIYSPVTSASNYNTYCHIYGVGNLPHCPCDTSNANIDCPLEGFTTAEISYQECADYATGPPWITGCSTPGTGCQPESSDCGIRYSGKPTTIAENDVYNVMALYDVLFRDWIALTARTRIR